MSYLIAGNTVRIMNDEDVILSNDIPVGIYKYCFNPKAGSWLEPYKYNTSHTKIYGDSGKIANHILKRYELNDSRDNLGVLFSGGKGLGKSLTVRLVVEKLKSLKPIIIVDQYTPDLPDFLCQISDSVILMDEFDKFMRGPSNDDDGPVPEGVGNMTKQESLLSVLDGVGNKLNNLYLLTCNDVSKIDANLISRPGRIKYHYKFDKISDASIRAYCKDNLDDKSQIDDIVRSLNKVMYVSFDIVKALVEELNLFEVSVQEALNYLNIAKPEKNLVVSIKWETYNEDDNNWRESKCYEHFYDVDLNGAISFSLQGQIYYIDLEKLDFSKNYVNVPESNIISEVKPKDIRNLSVKISFLGGEHIIGKTSVNAW